MRRIGDQITFGIKNSTGKIETLLNVGRNCRTLQDMAHLLGNGCEQISENRKPLGIWTCREYFSFLQSHLNMDITVMINRCYAPRFDDDG